MALMLHTKWICCSIICAYIILSPLANRSVAHKLQLNTHSVRCYENSSITKHHNVYVVVIWPPSGHCFVEFRLYSLECHFQLGWCPMKTRKRSMIWIFNTEKIKWIFKIPLELLIENHLPNWHLSNTNSYHSIYK